MKTSIMDFMQKMSSAFLIPVAFLSFAGLLMGVTSIFKMDYILSMFPIFEGSIFLYVNSLLFLIADLVFENLPILFCITVCIAMAKSEKAIAGFASVIGYLMFNMGMGYLLQYDYISSLFPENSIGTILGYKTLKTGVLGGIIAGIISAVIHNRSYMIKLPMALGFFSGIRFVAIAVSFCLLIFSQLFVFIWIPISEGIDYLAHLIGNAGIAGPFFYGFIERLLIPTGLHHVWNAVIRNTEISGTVIMGGESISGVLNIYSKYLQTGILPDMPMYEITRFLRGGQIPITMAVLPAIALAIYRSAALENRTLIKSLILSGVFTSFIAGITEPLEFAFLFASPVLYFIYALMCGLAYSLTYIFQTSVGGTEPNLFGLLIFGILRPETKWYINLLIGFAMAPFAYYIFLWYIKKYNIKTPGIDIPKEALLPQEEVIPDAIKNNPLKMKAYMIIKGLGGHENIESVENCISRLRVTLKDGSKFSENIIKTTECAGIVKVDEKRFQIIYGTSVNMIKEAVNKQIP